LPPSSKMTGPKISRTAPMIRPPKNWSNPHTTHPTIPNKKAHPAMRVRSLPSIAGMRFQVS
jgi:hypothetical protein